MILENFGEHKEGAEKGTEVVDTLGKLALDLKERELTGRCFDKHSGMYERMGGGVFLASPFS